MILLILRLVFVTTTSKNVISLIMASVLSVTANMLHANVMTIKPARKTATGKQRNVLRYRRPTKNVLTTAAIMTNASAAVIL